MNQPTTRRAPSRRITTAVVAAGLALGLTACSTEDTAGPAADETTATAKPHGYVEGASEAQEPQVRLLAVSADGSTTVHDLIADETTELDDVEAPDHSTTDGRFLVTSTGDRTTIIDGGAWTVDHGDHTHYYAAEPRVVGTIDGGGPVEVHSSETMTTITWPERGEGVVLDRAALGQGVVQETVRVDATVLLPFGEQLVAGTADGVRVLDADGEPTDGQPTGAEAACTDPAGGIVTRAGAVVGCADGAVVVGEDGGVTAVALPDGADRPTAFSARAGRPTVAGLAGDRGAWLLDSREGNWRLVETERPLRAVSAVDDEDEHVVGIDDQSRVVVLTASTGAIATTEPLLDPDEQPLLQLDAQRAYVADASGPQVHEIDFADGARVARSIDLTAAPVAFAEVGL
ncbi:ABC transporter [Curtobacterium sp. SGAir0471]|uniref:ABC transporter n=1 Tax=Curtobacterium sp. SGAir0471 TaxID=2070337 RepID=UPI0010CCC8B2|nr:ABC transporter [Curtobacterium sp. SGAir0471]QCR42319.1 ABC transporter [Curtobacterium sp. SGAir0471]